MNGDLQTAALNLAQAWAETPAEARDQIRPALERLLALAPQDVASAVRTILATTEASA